MSSLSSKLSLLGLILVVSTVSPGQDIGQNGQGPLPGITLHQLTRTAGYIFAGTVTAVEPKAATGHNVATMLITFQVERAIRGVQPGQMLVVREWAGLWEFGERYHRGERLLLFLYPSSKLGLTSPVGGALGRFAVDSHGQIVLKQGRAPALLPDPSSETRWRGKSRLSSHEFVNAIRHAVEE